MLVELHPRNPNPRDLRKVTAILDNDGLIIFPTDTIYAMACKLGNKRLIERMSRISGKKPEKTQFSLMCSDFTDISAYTAPITRPVFRLMKNNLPGPFTFILEASSETAKYFPGSRKTIGIRVPSNPISLAILAEIGRPLVVTTIHSDDPVLEYMTDPEEIHDKFMQEVDCVVDGGAGGNIPSTIIDCTGGEVTLIRQGKGIVNE